MAKGPRTGEFTAQRVFAAVKIITRAFHHASLESLEEAHQLVHDHFVRVVDASRGRFDNAAEQRVLGLLWAEIEMAIDDRRASEK